MASYTGGSREASRIKALEKERKQLQQEVERRKDAIVAAGSNVLDTASNFAARSGTVEDLLKNDTVGLVSHKDYKARRLYLERCAAEEREKRDAVIRKKDAESRKQRLKRANRARLSFDASDDDDSESSASGKNSPKKRRICKDPRADTTFLPDRERELAKQRERERLRQEWLNEQDRIKQEMVKITYSYWDGSGHRRVMRCKKGTTIGRFLAMDQSEFKELRNVSADSLMYIKEDLIIPHHYSFYDFIVNKARGVSYANALFTKPVHYVLIANMNDLFTDAPI